MSRTNSNFSGFQKLERPAPAPANTITRVVPLLRKYHLRRIQQTEKGFAQVDQATEEMNSVYAELTDAARVDFQEMLDQLFDAVQDLNAKKGLWPEFIYVEIRNPAKFLKLATQAGKFAKNATNSAMLKMFAKNGRIVLSAQLIPDPEIASENPPIPFESTAEMEAVMREEPTPLTNNSPDTSISENENDDQSTDTESVNFEEGGNQSTSPFPPPAATIPPYDAAYLRALEDNRPMTDDPSFILSQRRTAGSLYSSSNGSLASIVPQKLRLLYTLGESLYKSKRKASSDSLSSSVEPIEGTTHDEHGSRSSSQDNLALNVYCTESLR